MSGPGSVSKNYVGEPKGIEGVRSAGGECADGLVGVQIPSSRVSPTNEILSRSSEFARAVMAVEFSAGWSLRLRLGGLQTTRCRTDGGDATQR